MDFYNTPHIPEVEVRPALYGTQWVVTSWRGGPELPAGSTVRARLMRSQVCVGVLARRDGLLVLDPTSRTEVGS